MHSAAKGRKGEDRAAACLTGKGMTVIARNARSPAGEIDLVALDGEDIVFIEVKAWSAYGIEELQYGLNEKKQRRIIETAKYFLSSHRKYRYMTVRFDIVFIGPTAITHLASAFMEHV
jgi:putative endonuclease